MTEQLIYDGIIATVIGLIVFFMFKRARKG